MAVSFLCPQSPQSLDAPIAAIPRSVLPLGLIHHKAEHFQNPLLFARGE